MRWTLDWLKDYLNTDATARTIANALTLAGLEVEELIEPVRPIAAKICESSDIPNTHLHLLKVDDGSGLPRQVVCGAPNARAGLVSALARPGCKIGNMEIKAGKIRGFESNGMMCSEKELGLGEDHDGIIELDEKKYKIGNPLIEKKDSDNYIVFDAGITPNRPDYLSVRGIARDLSATSIAGSFINREFPVINNIAGRRKAFIQNPDRCPVYNFIEISDIKMAESGETIKRRLEAIGVNPKNACIDATNYVCYDLGQPMHCFDADEIDGDIIVRLAVAGEKFEDLFDAEHILTADDLVITDKKGILALAGIIGGKRGMTTENTKNILLESAYFEPVGIRKTAKRLGLKTDSSYRYERGIDPTITGEALDMATDIIQKACGGRIIAAIKDLPKYNPKIIRYDSELFGRKTGWFLDAGKQKEILEKLGYKFANANDLIVPSWRVDVDIPETIVSDIIRITGYVNLFADRRQVANPVIQKMGGKTDLLTHLGLTEVITYGFGNLAQEKLISDKPNVIIKNPITENMNTARNHLLPNMLNVIADNERRGFPDLALFECGNVFDGGIPGQEHWQLLIVRTGNNYPKHWQKRNRPVDVFDVRADLNALIGANVWYDVKTDNPPKWAHPYRYGRIELPEIGFQAEFAELHPGLAKKFGIKTNVEIAFIENAEKGIAEHLKKPITDFQPIKKDFAFWCAQNQNAQDIIRAAFVDQQIRDIMVFDVFEKDGQKSIAFTITAYPDKNMTDADLQEMQNRIIASVEKTGAKIRDK
ncbi:MAG: phenylalanine--tRNA ligase subunit beta [Rickettsiales bacterium]|nr:phenylalanine--tRNA ligase subunit beta [Rickettsiales bacterium]